MLVRLCYNDEVGQPSFDVYHGHQTTCSTAVVRVYDGRRTTRKKAFSEENNILFTRLLHPFLLIDKRLLHPNFSIFRSPSPTLLSRPIPYLHLIFTTYHASLEAIDSL